MAGGETVMAKTIAQFKEQNRRLGLSPRQMRLNKLWSYYRCAHYDVRSVNWDGTKRDDPIEHEAIASIGYIPPGFYDAAGTSLPLRYRKPTAPYNLAKVITDRFTGLLFSQQRHPHFRVAENTDGQQYIEDLAEGARFWPAMIQARTFGGAMGSVAAGFSFIGGKPVIEIHDTRWMYPDFEDRLSLTLRRIEKRYMYPVEQQNRETGEWEEIPYWYRRVIDKKSDIVYQPEPVGNGDEPDWKVQSQVDHDFGFCPVVWAQNLPVLEDIDGDPDCHGVYDLIESHDSLVAQSYKSLIANCDPTVVITSDAANLKDINIGSDSALKLPKDSDAKFLETAGGGAEAALELASKMREMTLEVAQCVLEAPGDTAKTATEVNRLYSSMLSKGDVLREQYGEKLCKPLMLMILNGAAMFAVGIKTEKGIVKGGLLLPGRPLEPVDPALAEANIQLQWPPYFEPSLDDIAKAGTAAAAAVQGRILDRAHAVDFAGPYFGVEDTKGLAEALDQQVDEENQQMMDQMNAMGSGDGEGGGGAPKAPQRVTPDVDTDNTPSPKKKPPKGGGGAI